VREPSLYLLDEPLSNLDAKLRTQMRAEITALYRRVRKTFVYMMHDQVEAMTMGTRIIVLDNGVVQQFGTPQAIYQRPANTFVAQFIGSPPMNILPVEVSGGRAAILETDLTLEHEVRGLLDGRYRLGIRPENVSLTDDPSEGLLAHVVDVEHLGGETVLGFRLGKRQDSVGLGDTATRNQLYLKLPGNVATDVGTECGIRFEPPVRSRGLTMTRGCAWSLLVPVPSLPKAAEPEAQVTSGQRDQRGGVSTPYFEAAFSDCPLMGNFRSLDPHDRVSSRWHQVCCQWPS